MIVFGQDMHRNEHEMAAYSWDDLQFFLALARDGQLTRAARQLGTSHVTVSRRIDRLEQALRQRLFERNPRGYALTAAGRRLIEAAERMEEATAGIAIAGDTASPLGGVLRLAVPEGFGAFFSEQILPDFVAAFPRISLDLITMTQVLSLSRRESDVTVTLDAVTKGPYLSELVSPYSLRVYGSRSYLAQHPPLTTREDLLNHRFIGYIEEMLFAAGLDYLDELHPALRANIKSSSIFNQLSATRRGLGLCVLPDYLAAGQDDLLPVLPDQITLRRNYWLTCHRDLRQMRRERAVIRFLQDRITALAPVLLPDQKAAR